MRHPPRARERSAHSSTNCVGFWIGMLAGLVQGIQHGAALASRASERNPMRVGTEERGRVNADRHRLKP